jgi:hypothetical protein
MNIGFALDDDVARADAPGNLARKVNRGGIAMQIAAQPPFDESRPANDAAAGQIAFCGQMHISACANCPAEPAGDLVVAQINMRAARRTDRRRGRTANLLFAFTFKALDNSAALPFPEILKSADDGGIRWRGRCFFADPQLQAGFRRKRRKVPTALAANRAFRRCILRLLEAAVRAFHTDFCGRRAGHRTLTPKFPLISVLRMPL